MRSLRYQGNITLFSCAGGLKWWSYSTLRESSASLFILLGGIWLVNPSQQQRLQPPLRLLPLAWGQRLEAGQEPPRCCWRKAQAHPGPQRSSAASEVGGAQTEAVRWAGAACTSCHDAARCASSEEYPRIAPCATCPPSYDRRRTVGQWHGCCADARPGHGAGRGWRAACRRCCAGDRGS